MTANELNELTLSNKLVQKLSKCHITVQDIENMCLTTRKSKRKLYISTQIEDVESVNDILKGYEFCVLTGTSDWSKEAVQKRILENGGTVVLTEGQYYILTR